ncbi:hypothetical protein GUITHDRAFT_109510 [Guillardia theta CCMP2712]|uniref:Uncharacterized protein n=1 Tax=Guillardia theta (strain CCMP2712) TaxID=905079 RepID=L1J8S9_GUITC|nr:hypothetical protein GUITHDRAFT_109510 [Guillardia theta CCMP2712]EKX44732.1 hypothetical protein GUITHDRAFT_109510 [Guillardia theta CCMP2712]|eukprot:XP_005831712.1 hypothetical protein GUITHDRAFT_109510 [Guillardia theta CCMP2712]
MQGYKRHEEGDNFKEEMEGLMPGKYALRVDVRAVLALTPDESIDLNVTLQDQLTAYRSDNCVNIPLTSDGLILGEEVCKTIRTQDSTRNECENVTFVTSATIDRLPTLLNLLAHWSRPVSVAIYARTHEEERQISLFVRKYVLPWCSKKHQSISICMLTACIDESRPPFILPFPVNRLRRLATSIAKTDLVIYADIDLLPSADLGSIIMEKFLSRQVQGWKDVLVIPSFRSSDESWPSPASILGSDNDVWIEAEPIKTDSLLERFLNETVTIPGLKELELPRGDLWFHSSVFHAPTDYARWFNAKSLYEVDYVLGYEPYVVLNRSDWHGQHGWGLWDEAFDTWGWDKASFTFEVAHLGYSFLVSNRGALLHASLSQYDFPDLPHFSSTSRRTRADGWGPPDTVGRRRFLELVQREQSRRLSWMIKSCLVSSFLVDCDKSDLSNRVEVRVLSKHRNGSLGFIKSWSLAGLTHHVGYLFQLEILEAEEEQEFLIQRQFVWDAWSRQQKVLEIHVEEDRQNATAIRAVLKDLHASQLLGYHSILYSFEHVMVP